MAKLRHTFFKEWYIIPFSFYDESRNKIVNNRDLPEEEQVKAKVRLATSQQRNDFIYNNSSLSKDNPNEINSRVKSSIDIAITDNVEKLKGLEDLNISDGRSLINYINANETSIELNKIVDLLFDKICGADPEDQNQEKK